MRMVNNGKYLEAIGGKTCKISKPPINFKLLVLVCCNCLDFSMEYENQRKASFHAALILYSVGVYL